MSRFRNWISGFVLTCLIALMAVGWLSRETDLPLENRQEVLFWHFWGGRDRAVVNDVVKRFNESQDRFFVAGGRHAWQ